MDPIAEIKEITEKLKNSYNWSDTNFDDYLQNLDETGQFEGGKEKRHIRHRFIKFSGHHVTRILTFYKFSKREIACHIVIEIAIIGYCLFISVQSVAQNISNAWLLVFTMLYICQWIGFLANAASINELGYHFIS